MDHRHSSHGQASDEAPSLESQQLSPNPTTSAAPTSTLLQDLLREKRAQTRIQPDSSRKTSRQSNAFDGRDIQSSPIGPVSPMDGHTRQSRRSSGFGLKGLGVSKEMGVRETEEVRCLTAPSHLCSAYVVAQHISKINKQNFDLKLELYHRRQKNEALEAKLEKMQQLHAKNQELEIVNQELQVINEDLHRELERRNQAIHEAVSSICQLEAKVEALELNAIDTRPTTATQDLDCPRSDTESCVQPLRPPPQSEVQVPSTPIAVSNLPSRHAPNDLKTTPVLPVKSPKRGTPVNSKTPWRTPSFLREKNESTNALRGLYMANEDAANSTFSLGPIPRPSSLFSKDGSQNAPDPDSYALNSPRLSILSESSFLSVYGKHKDLGIDSQNEEEDGEPDDTKSMNERAHFRDDLRDDSRQRGARIQKWVDGHTPSPTKQKASRNRANDQFSSIEGILHEESPSSKDASTVSAKKHKSRLQRSDSSSSSKTPSLAGPIFGLNPIPPLPPTPDTMGTPNKELLNNSTNSVVTERSLLNGTQYPANGYSALVPDARPHTADSAPVVSNYGEAQGLGTDAGFEDLRGKPESTHVEQSEFSDTPKTLISPRTESMFMGSSINNTQATKSKRLIRPPLTTYGTDMMFNGEGYDAIQSSRNQSYPSPAPNHRRRSLQPSIHHGASGLSSADSPTLPPKEWLSASSDIGTPPQPEHENNPNQFLSCDYGEEEFTTDDSTFPADAPRTDADSKLPRSALRFKLPKMSLGPNTTTRPNVASRLFGRSNSQSVIVEPTDSKERPRTLSSADRQPRPSNPFFQSNIKPPTTIPNPKLSYVAHPGPAGNHDRQAPTQPPNQSRRRSGLWDSLPRSNTEGNVGTRTERDSPVNGPGPRRGGPSDAGSHQRTESESRQSTRDEGTGGKKWGMGIGRSESFRGFGKRMVGK